MTVGASMARRELIDSAAYFALADPRDHKQVAAAVILERLAAEHWRVFTTNFIVAEIHAIVLARRGRNTAARVLDEIDHSATVIVRVSAGNERRAREIIATYEDKNFSLTDALSFAVMERLRIGHAFTFDHHFAQYGFTVLTAP